MTKPSWDDFLMSMAFLSAMRSMDSQTKHGCVIVDSKHSVLATGYNSPPPGCRDDLIPTTRPEKYPYFVHAEEAAIANAARKGVKLEGGIAYVTGMPCERCFRSLLSAGIIEMVLGPAGSACVSEDTRIAMELMMKGRSGVTIRFHKLTTSLFHAAQEYYIEKETEADA